MMRRGDLMTHKPNSVRRWPLRFIGFLGRCAVAYGDAIIVVFLVGAVGSFGAFLFFMDRIPSPPPANWCINHLKQIQGAKMTWAMEEGKSTNDTPTSSDLFGPSRYIAQMPSCGNGGTYTLGKVGDMPQCTIPRHCLDPQTFVRAQGVVERGTEKATSLPASTNAPTITAE